MGISLGRVGWVRLGRAGEGTQRHGKDGSWRGRGDGRGRGRGRGDE